MKHILSINELYKSTYISAADKISRGQDSRKYRLKRHADLKGINEPIDREFHYRFTFDKVKLPPELYYMVNPKGFDQEELKKMGPFAPNPPYFFITDFKYDRDQEFGGWSVVLKVKFKSNYGDVLKTDCCLYLDKDGKTCHPKLFVTYGDNGLRRFYFNNRKDANMFKKFLIKEVLPELESQKIIAIKSEYLINNFSETTYKDNGKDKPVIKLVKGDPTRCYIPLHYINNISINEIYEEG
jgi:hypothetical protein